MDRFVDELPLFSATATLAFVDVVGSVQRVNSDERPAVQRIRALLAEAAREVVARHQGWLIERRGDGLLLRFEHARQSVRCAQALHRNIIQPALPMSRPLRLEFANALYHVTSRGDRREAIFVDDADRSMWLELFGQVSGRFNWRCHAWCLMTNHYHLLVETPEPNLSQGMRQLNGVYTQRVSRRHGQVGHVFQGRFKAILVERESCLLELARCVVLNPVRARMVGDAGACPGAVTAQ